MMHTKSNVDSLVKVYQEMYNILNNWGMRTPINENNDNYICKMSYAVNSLVNSDFTDDAVKNEIRHYREINKAYDFLMSSLEAALGMEQKSCFER